MLAENLSAYKSLFSADAHTELRAQLNRTRRVIMVSGNLAANERADVSGVSARVYKGGVCGFSSAAAADGDSVRSVLDAATRNAIFMDSRAGRGKPLFAPLPAEDIVRAPEYSDPAQKLYIDAARELDCYIAEKYPGLAGRTVMAYSDCMEKQLVTSDGCSSVSAAPRSYIYIGLTAVTDSGAPVELFQPFGASGSFDANFADVSVLFPKIDALHEQLMQKREGIYPEAGLKTCILSGLLSGMLSHEAVGHTVEADLVLAGSVAAHNLGCQVASELVSMTDFAHTAFGAPAPLPVYADDEGVIAKDAPLIRDGVLVGYMNNRESAQHFGVEPAGNARAWLFSDEPIIRMRNTAIHPGTSTLDEMIASVDDGYYLINTGNGQADTTGEFMFGITMGYEIRHGKLGRALLDTTISGVAFDMLKTVDMVSDELEWCSAGFCGKKQPMSVGMGGPSIRCRVTMGGR